MGNLPATLLPQAPSLWILEPCRDPPPVPVLTLEVEEMVVAVMTSALVIFCKQPAHFMLSCLKLKQDIEAKAAGQFPPRYGWANPFTRLEVETGAQPGAVPSAGTTPPENGAEQLVLAGTTAHSIYRLVG